jgi:hypothetical protein
VAFDEVVAALESLAEEGVVVEASVWGVGAASSSLMSQGGLLRRLSAEGDFPDLEGESAVVFAVGDVSHSFELWPSRFEDASADDLNGISITTRDGRLRVRKNRPWID